MPGFQPSLHDDNTSEEPGAAAHTNPPTLLLKLTLNPAWKRNTVEHTRCMKTMYFKDTQVMEHACVDLLIGRP